VKTISEDTKKVIIVGIGFVGTAITYSIVNQGIAEIGIN